MAVLIEGMFEPHLMFLSFTAFLLLLYTCYFYWIVNFLWAGHSAQKVLRDTQVNDPGCASGD
jgi:hypothetical protein